MRLESLCTCHQKGKTPGCSALAVHAAQFGGKGMAQMLNGKGLLLLRLLLLQCLGSEWVGVQLNAWLCILVNAFGL